MYFEMCNVPVNATPVRNKIIGINSNEIQQSLNVSTLYEVFVSHLSSHLFSNNSICCPNHHHCHCSLQSSDVNTTQSKPNLEKLLNVISLHPVSTSYHSRIGDSNTSLFQTYKSLHVMTSSTCPHVSECVGRLSASDLAQLLSNVSCDVCKKGIGMTNLWLCVYPDCYMMGCAETKSDHSTQHNRDHHSHAIQLNVTNKRSWCYLCKGEVILSNNSPKVAGVLGSKLRDEDDESSDRSSSSAGLVGLTNLGNTCYMNSALQCLSNTPTLTKYFLSCAMLLPTDIKPNLGQAYAKLMMDLWQTESAGEPRHEFVAPTGVLHAIKQAWPAFRGFQQHDAQEFLRCFMDQLHKELLEPVTKDEEQNDESDESEYESADNDNEDNASMGNSRKKRQRRETESGVEGKKGATVYRSIVTDIFDGALQSSVQCLTCNTVSKTKETFQDLSLPIPTSDRINNKSEEGWMSWAWWWLSSE